MSSLLQTDQHSKSKIVTLVENVSVWLAGSPALCVSSLSLKNGSKVK